MKQTKYLINAEISRANLRKTKYLLKAEPLWDNPSLAELLLSFNSNYPDLRLICAELSLFLVHSYVPLLSLWNKMKYELKVSPRSTWMSKHWSHISKCTLTHYLHGFKKWCQCRKKMFLFNIGRIMIAACNNHIAEIIIVFMSLSKIKVHFQAEY